MITEKTTPWYSLHSPEIGETFQDFYEACGEKGVLDKKTKELLMLTLASVFRCPHCTEEHIKEALLIAALEGAGTQLAWAKEIYLRCLGTGDGK